MMDKSILTTLRHDLCTGCGVCEDACPKKAITIAVDKGNFRPVVNDGICVNCGICLKTCPGVGFDFKKYHDEKIAEDLSLQYDKMVGAYRKCFTGYSNEHDIRWHSASGGMVSQFLIWLLENGKIDGAIVTRFDKDNELLVKTYIARTREEVIAGRSSKYAPVTMAGMASAIKESEGNRFVVVGIPCHIEGFRKLMAIDKKLREKITGLFAIYCSSGRSFYLTEHVFKERGIDQTKLSYLQYRDEGCLGSMVVKTTGGEIGTRGAIDGNFENVPGIGNMGIYKERYQSYYHPLRSFFVPKRCLFCIDHYGEVGDICFGDIHIEPYIADTVGVNSIVVKNQKWLDLILECKASGAIALDEIPFKTVGASQIMSFKKKGRNGAFINLNKILGRKVPKYDVDYLRLPTMYDTFDWCQNRFQQFLGRHKSLWWLVSILKSDTSKLK